MEEGWQLEETVNSLALFRKSDSPELDLVGKADLSEIETRLNQPIIDLPDLKLRGYNIRQSYRLGHPVVETMIYLECNRKVKQDYLLTARFHQQGGGRFSFGQSFFAPYRIFPTSQWEPGKIIKQQCAIMIPHEAPSGEYDMTISLLKSAGQGEFEGKIIYTKNNALEIKVAPQ